MRYIAIMLVMLNSTWAIEINDKFINAVRAEESGGERNPHRAVGDRGESNGAYQIKFGAWWDCNGWLKEEGFKTWAYKDYVNDPTISHYYCKLYLTLQLRDLIKAKIGRDITYVDVYCAYNMGLEGYRRIGFNPEKHPFPKKLKRLGDKMRK